MTATSRVQLNTAKAVNRVKNRIPSINEGDGGLVKRIKKNRIRPISGSDGAP